MRDAARSRSGSKAWIIFKLTWRPTLKLLLLSSAAAGCIVSLAIVCIGVLEYPVPFACAVLAGALIRRLGQWVQVRRLRSSHKPFPFAAFHFQEGAIRCELRKERARAYVTALPWKLASALVAGAACWEAQRLALIHIDLQGLLGAHPFLSPFLHVAGQGLPFFAGALFIVLDGPVESWTSQVQTALQARADRALAEVLRDREIDGLDRAIQNIHEQLGCHRSSSYRSAIEKRLRSQTEALVLNPHSVSALVEALTEAARLEWEELSEGLSRFRAVETEIRALQAAASLLREPLVESRADELMGELKETATFVAHWRWEDFQKQLLHFERQVDDTHRRLRDRRASAPAPVLAPGSDPYRLLGADPAAPTASIRKLRLRLAQVYHPDIGGETCNAAKMAEVNAAYDAILRERDGHSR